MTLGEKGETHPLRKGVKVSQSNIRGLSTHQQTKQSQVLGYFLSSPADDDDLQLRLYLAKAQITTPLSGQKKEQKHKEKPRNTTGS